MARVLFYVQHLLGLGHGARSAAITRELQATGLDVTYVSGGVPTEILDLGGARMVQLPPLRAADATYDGLLDENDTPPDDGYWEARRKKLTAAMTAEPPDIVLVETFPFGRWPFRREIRPLLEASHGQARILCSVRDILEPKAENRRNDAIIDLIGRYFDLILVHGDPDLVTLDRTFARTAEIAVKIRYTGYVTPPPPVCFRRGDVVVVSAGGGATCETLMAAAGEAATRDDRPWRFLLGPNCPATVRETLSRITGITVEPVRSDFREILSRAALSISQAGYNTTMDILTTGTPAVMVPFAGHGQIEQALRARLLAERHRVAVVEEADLTPESLLAATRQAEGWSEIAPPELDLDGARRTARIVAGAASSRALWASTAAADIKTP